MSAGRLLNLVNEPATPPTIAARMDTDMAAKAAAFEWLRQLAIHPDGPREAATALCAWAEAALPWISIGHGTYPDRAVAVLVSVLDGSARYVTIGVWTGCSWVFQGAHWHPKAVVAWMPCPAPLA